jgi:hypothetical protein
MQHAYPPGNGAISEMMIVDTFTKLIFGEQGAYSDLELGIIQAFRAVDTNVALDSHEQMGEYLRALGVEEMIRLVSQVREQLGAGLHPPADTANHLARNRRAH